MILMRRVLYLVYMFSMATLILSGSCKKNGGGGGTNEPALSVELNPAANSNQLPAPGPDFPLTVTIKSTMPAAGVKIDVSAREDVGGSTPFFNQSVTSSTSVNNFSITGSPRNVTIRVTVTVTSLSTSTNTFTGSYTYSRK
jgi:hypothetical protein